MYHYLVLYNKIDVLYSVIHFHLWYTPMRASLHVRGVGLGVGFMVGSTPPVRGGGRAPFVPANDIFMLKVNCNIIYLVRK